MSTNAFAQLRHPARVPWWRWIEIAGGAGLLVLVVLFLPYNYEAGGDFIVLPNQQQSISTEIGGIIQNINYDGGETLEKGTVIGQISHSDTEARLKIYAAKIKQQEAVIRELKSKPTPEELQLAPDLEPLVRR